jgi:hypothetical protein
MNPSNDYRRGINHAVKKGKIDIDKLKERYQRELEEKDREIERLTRARLNAFIPGNDGVIRESSTVISTNDSEYRRIIDEQKREIASLKLMQKNNDCEMVRRENAQLRKELSDLRWSLNARNNSMSFDDVIRKALCSPCGDEAKMIASAMLSIIDARVPEDESIKWKIVKTRLGELIV